ncbi:TonB-dependent receptor P26 [subsurface metagenome]
MIVCVGVFLFTAQSSLLGQKTISGVVRDGSTNEPLIGATVVVKGTQLGVVTDVDGNYTINAPADTGILVFSFVGYIDEERPLGSELVIDIDLLPDLEALDEIVVIGYGTEKKSHLTGSVGKLSSEGLDQIPVSRADQALQGKLAGLSIKNIEGDVGSTPEIRVRGMG